MPQQEQTSLAAVQFDELVINAEQQEGRRPLPDKQGVMGPSAAFKNKRGEYGPTGRPQEQIGGEFRRSTFDGAGDLAFGISGLSFCNHNNSPLLWNKSSAHRGMTATTAATGENYVVEGAERRVTPARTQKFLPVNVALLQLFRPS
jgi:hypothetical protein